ncbi:MAG TPA: hypothetical protein PKC62_10785, partial [Ferruginibacter sp.]|nr:hypothetical protein [Ferruginibacter sp.]
EKSGQAPHWTTFVLDAGVPTVNVGTADKTPPKVECRPTHKYTILPHPFEKKLVLKINVLVLCILDCY